MHQIVQRLGLRPRPYWGSSERSPNPLAGRGEGKGVEGGGNRKGKGSEGRLPPLKFKSGALGLRVMFVSSL